ncbi:MAG: hypothetical protein NT041_00825, partial [Candidatus Vogelbacteria bacterium]|nr:hypothetical protein [Candidatus Vogelbacteria bacterium]
TYPLANLPWGGGIIGGLEVNLIIKIMEEKSFDPAKVNLKPDLVCPAGHTISSGHYGEKSKDCSTCKENAEWNKLSERDKFKKTATALGEIEF